MRHITVAKANSSVSVTEWRSNIST